MTQGKVPGPDGFTSNFFHFFWGMIKEEVWAIVKESRTSIGVLKVFNATFLSLIPKSEGADVPGKFRPIALCNVIYKIIAKVIANRLKPLLPGLISPEQSGFVEGQQILDGIITVQEAIHSLKCTRIPGMLIKLDIAKAYDKLSWEYLEKMLQAFGFCQEWVEWVMGLVSCPFFSILLNKSPTRLFSPSKGIRQGDLLSPFLFILDAEGLSKLIKAQVGQGRIRGLSFYEDMDKQTHQQFVDDIMLMEHPSIQEVRAYKTSLVTFAKASGLEVNPEKCQIFFFNTLLITQRNIGRILRFQKGMFPTKYLGVPLGQGVIRKSS